MHSQDLRGSGTVRLRQTDQPSRLSKNSLLLMPVLSVVLFFSPVSNLMTLRLLCFIFPASVKHSARWIFFKKSPTNKDYHHCYY